MLPPTDMKNRSIPVGVFQASFVEAAVHDVQDMKYDVLSLLA